SMARATCGMPQEPLVTPKMEMPAFSHQETTVRVLFSIFSRSMVTCGPGMGLVHINESIRVDLKLAAGNQIGDKLPRSRRHGPADMAMAAIEEEIAIAGRPQDGHRAWRHGSEARPIFRLRLIYRAGEQLLRGPEQAAEIGRPVAAVVACEFGRARHSQPVAEPRIGDETISI